MCKPPNRYIIILSLEVSLCQEKRTPEELEHKTKIRELVQELDINDMSDINTLFKEFVGDIKGEFGPQLVKNSKHLCPEILRKNSFHITDKVLPVVKEWQQRRNPFCLISSLPKLSGVYKLSNLPFFSKIPLRRLCRYLLYISPPHVNFSV